MLNFVIANHEDQFTQYMQKQCENWSINVALKLDVIDWSQLRGKLRSAAARRDVDVAEAGSTWLNGMVQQGNLRPFQPAEIERIGGEELFVHAHWHHLSQTSQRGVYGIPWMVDARVIFYWSDMLTEAGIQEDDAFASPQQMEATLNTLRAQGMPTPWVMPTEPLADVLHNIASWVWSAGGDFLDSSEKVCIFSDERTLEGIQAQFRLHRFMPRPDYPLDENSMTRLFEKRQTAAAICGPYFGRTLRQTLSPDMLEKVKVALPPGPPFSGGSYLVIMNHLDSRFETAAINWITHMMSVTVQKEIYQMTGLLPARMEAMHSGLVLTHQHDRMYAEAVLRGRHLPAVAAWDTVEPALVTAFAGIWAKLKQPDLPVNDIVAQEMRITENRLNALLKRKD